MGIREKRVAELLPNATHDSFVSGFASVELIGGGCVRLIPFIIKGHERMEAEHPVIMPLSACADLIGMLVSAAGAPITIAEDGKIVFLN